MRKNDLIKMLQNIKGNPEVLLWNGMVGDWMHIDKPVESDLVRIDKDYFLETCRLAECKELGDWDHQLSPEEIKDCEKSYKNCHGWEDNAFVTEEDIKEKRYRKKRVLYLQAKKRGVSTFDRLGNIEY